MNLQKGGWSLLKLNTKSHKTSFGFQILFLMKDLSFNLCFGRISVKSTIVVAVSSGLTSFQSLFW